MIKDKFTRADLIWSYIAKGISMSSGLISLPLILRMLSQDEIALNYLFVSIMSLASLFDLGFSSQFSRNFAFIFGGGQDVVEKGITNNIGKELNYRTLYLLINSAKYIYLILSIIMALMLLTGGTLYIYKFTDGFKLIDNTFPLWLLFVVSVVLDFYYKYYTPLLMGEKRIKEVSQISVISTVLRLIILSLTIIAGGRLWSIVIGNIVSIIVSVLLYKRCFFSDFIKEKFSTYSCDFSEIKIVTKKLWYNAKWMAIVRLSTYMSTQLIVFLSGLFLTKQDVSSLGLLVQLTSIVSMVSVIMNNSYVPMYSSLRIVRNYKEIYKNLTLSLGSFYYLSILGYAFIILCVPFLLRLIGSNAELPAIPIVLVYLLYKFLEDQHCICSIYLTTSNVIVDRHSAPLIGFIVALGLFLVLKLTSWGLWGMVLIQFFVPLCYPNWKWPWEVCKEFNIHYFRLVSDSLLRVVNVCRSLFYFKKV